MDIANRASFPGITSGPRDADGDDEPRHDQWGEDDDVEVGDEVDCAFQRRRTNASSAAKLGDISIVRSNDDEQRRLMSSQSDSYVLLTRNDATNWHQAKQREVENREKALERGERLP